MDTGNVTEVTYLQRAIYFSNLADSQKNLSQYSLRIYVHAFCKFGSNCVKLQEQQPVLTSEVLQSVPNDPKLKVSYIWN